MSDFIQSASNPAFKSALKLATQRRERLKQGKTLLDGAHLLAAWLDAGLQLERVFVTEEGLHDPEIAALLRRHPGTPCVLAAPLYAQLSELPSPSGVLAIASFADFGGMPLQRGLCLALDGIQDPGNLGSILRTAAAAGVDQVWAGLGCADVWSPKVLRAGMGAHAVLDICDRVELLPLLAGFSGRIAATLLDGAIDLYRADWTGDVVLVMGSEGTGVSPAIAGLASLRLRIPMQPGIESLNVAAAAAICLYERVRQCGLPAGA
ncbi:TrmH family RNA methyltransferase [Chitinilyticum litopenaei]|uniref:TrmH family RNA methyltransferase n=1 Tax=Chitinilyticum litopenaei TaxID=1121276 RepID=UPI0004013B49|nr:RNA methyltransferase [Chitinilyticum litopenaei]